MKPWRRRLHRARGTVSALAHQTAHAGRSVMAEAERAATRRPPRWTVWAAVALAALLAPGLVEMGRLALRERAMERDLAALEAREAALRAEKTRLEEDPVYVEGLIRSTFKQARKDEIVIPLRPADRAR